VHPSLILLVGTQASGKSTYAKDELPGLPLVSSDSWFLKDGEGRMYWIDDDGCQCYYSEGLNPKVLAKAWAFVWQRFGQLLQEGKSFVIEGTYPTRISRSHLIHIAKAFGYNVEVVWFNTTLEECLTRNRARVNVIPDAVLARTFANMEPPTWDEGWHHLEIVPRHT
jgi:predicted kinase